MDLDSLRKEIVADPDLKALAIAGRDGDISRAMTVENSAEKVDFNAMIDVLSSESVRGLMSNPNFGAFRADIDAQSYSAVANWIKGFSKAGIVTQADAAVCAGALAAATPNGRTVTVEEVNKALRPHRPDGKAGSKHWSEEPVNGVA